MCVGYRLPLGGRPVARPDLSFCLQAWWHPQPSPNGHTLPGFKAPTPLAPAPPPSHTPSCRHFRRPLLLLPRCPVVFFKTQSFVDYVRFCGAVEPRTGGRDLDNQRRVLDEAWKAKPKESTPKTNPLSGGAPSRQQHHQTRHPLSGRSWESGDPGRGREHTQSVRFKRPPLPPPVQSEVSLEHYL